MQICCCCCPYALAPCAAARRLTLSQFNPLLEEVAFVKEGGQLQTSLSPADGKIPAESGQVQCCLILLCLAYNRPCWLAAGGCRTDCRLTCCVELVHSTQPAISNRVCADVSDCVAVAHTHLPPDSMIRPEKTLLIDFNKRHIMCRCVLLLLQ